MEDNVKRACWLLLMVCLGLTQACASRHGGDFAFANRMARVGLWKEALYRYQKLLASGHEKASIHNNLAIALENLGRYDEADAEYKKALVLDPGNANIKGNHEQLKKLRGGK